MVLRTSKRYGLFYGCNRFPACKGSHSAHQETGEPMGVPANQTTKRWRRRAHKVFDLLWSSGCAVMSRDRAYKFMQEEMGLSVRDAHISRLSSEECQALIDIVLDFLVWRARRYP